MRRLPPLGIRLRLVLAISAVSVAAVAASFFALHERTASNLRGRIDRELTEQYAEFQQRALQRGGVTDQSTLAREGRSFVTGQRYHPEARIFLISPRGMPPVTNQPRIVDEELSESEGGEAGEGAGGGIVDAPDGLSTVSTDETGELRVLTQPVLSAGARIGTFRVADPLTSVDQALAELRNTFIAVGIGALILSVAIADLAREPDLPTPSPDGGVASAVDSGDLSHRIDYRGDRRGRRARRFLQPHARQARGGVSP